MRSSDCKRKTDITFCESLPCDIAELGKHFETVKRSAIEGLQILLIVNKSDVCAEIASNGLEAKSLASRGRITTFERFSLNIPSGSPPRCYRLVISGGALIIHEIQSISQGKCEFGKQLCCRPYRKKIRNVFFDHGLSHVIIQADDGSFDLLARRNKYEAQKFDIVLENEFLCLYILSDQIYQCYWSAEKKCICFYHTDKTFECDAMPKLISSEMYPFVLLLTRENEIVAYNLIKDDFVFIPFII